MADRAFQLSSSQTSIDFELEFLALSVVVHNPTNQWVYLPSLGVTIPQYTISAVYPLPATLRARAVFQAPAGQVNPPTIAAQTAQVIFNSLALPPSAGVGMLGGRAPYYDRNPLSIYNFASATQAAGAGGVTLWSYTVPAGRRAYIETAFAMVQITTAYDTDNAAIESIIDNASAVVIVHAIFLRGTVLGTWAGSLVGASLELQGGENIRGRAADSRAIGTGFSYHEVSFKGTEFDQ